METLIYSKPNCPYCVNAKKLLELKGIPFEEKVLDVDFTREQLLEKFPEAKTFPQVILEGEHVGGYTDLAKKFG
jgi:glutaredoxin 3